MYPHWLAHSGYLTCSLEPGEGCPFNVVSPLTPHVPYACYNQSFFGVSPVRLSVGKDKMKLRSVQVFLLRDIQFIG